MKSVSPTPSSTRLICQNSTPNSVGTVWLAGFIKGSEGVPVKPMRVLGKYAIVYLVGGEGRYADLTGAGQTVRPGQLVFVYPERAHTYGPTADGHWDEFYIVFDGPVFDLWRPLIERLGPVVTLAPTEYWLPRLAAVVEEGTPQTPGEAMAQVCRLQTLLSEIVEHGRDRSIDDDDRSFLASAKSLLDPVHSTPVDTPAVARRLGLNPETFRKRFARLTGMSPTRYTDRRLMDRMADLLRDPDMTLADIADRGGFCDAFHFSRRFKQIIGLSPTEFRRHLKSR